MKKLVPFIVLSLLLLLLGTSSYYFSNGEGTSALTNNPAEQFDEKKNCLDLIVPTEISVGEKISFGVEKGRGFDLRSADHIWTVVARGNGKGHFANGEIVAQTARPEFIATEKDEVTIAVSSVREGNVNQNGPCDRRIVMQGFTLKIK